MAEKTTGAVGNIVAATGLGKKDEFPTDMNVSNDHYCRDGSRDNLSAYNLLNLLRLTPRLKAKDSELLSMSFALPVFGLVNKRNKKSKICWDEEQIARYSRAAKTAFFLFSSPISINKKIYVHTCLGIS